MNSERNIIMKLNESKKLDESGFDKGGSRYRCNFGRYTKDGKPISREEYFSAKGEEVKATPDKEKINKYSKKLASKGSRDTKQSLAHHPAASPEALSQLADDESYVVRYTLAHRKNLPTEVLEKLIKDKDENVRRAVAENETTPPEILAKLAEEPEMRSTIIRNNATPEKLRNELIKDRDANDYSKKYSIGDKVRFIHAGDQLSDEVATIIGYDDEGFYKYKWDDGEISSGVGDTHIVGEDEDYDDYQESVGNSERNIVNKLQGKKVDLDEVWFDTVNGHYACSWGNYYKDGQPITREEYIKARDEYTIKYEGGEE